MEAVAWRPDDGMIFKWFVFGFEPGERVDAIVFWIMAVCVDYNQTGLGEVDTDDRVRPRLKPEANSLRVGC